MVYPRECYEHSTYNVDTQELLLRRDRGMYVPFMYSLLLANASNHAIYLSCEGGRQDTLRKRWKRADPGTRGCEPPLITFALAAYLASEYATKYSTKPEGMNIKVPLLRVVRALDECRSRGADTTLNPDSTSSQTQGRRFISKACNAVNGAQVIPATMAALYLLLQDDHFISHEFVTHSANLFTKDYMMKRKVWSTMFPCPLYYTSKHNPAPGTNFSLCADGHGRNRRLRAGYPSWRRFDALLQGCNSFTELPSTTC